MKKYMKYIVLLALPMLMLGACSGEEVVGPSLSLTSSSLSVKENGGIVDLKFASAMDWTAKSNQNWCVLSQTSGSAGDYTLKLTVSPNPTFIGREAVITLKSGTGTEAVSEQVIVVQAACGGAILVVKHQGTKFTAPAFEVLSSLYVKGTIRWGDGQSEDYTNSASHSYADNKEHSISFDLTGVGAVEFSDVVGVTEIDFTNF